jgi:hypothetical protein
VGVSMESHGDEVVCTPPCAQGALVVPWCPHCAAHRTGVSHSVFGMQFADIVCPIVTHGWSGMTVAVAQRVCGTCKLNSDPLASFGFLYRVSVAELVKSVRTSGAALLC